MADGAAVDAGVGPTVLVLLVLAFVVAVVVSVVALELVR